MVERLFVVLFLPLYIFIMSFFFFPLTNVYTSCIARFYSRLCPFIYYFHFNNSICNTFPMCSLGRKIMKKTKLNGKKMCSRVVFKVCMYLLTFAPQQKTKQWWFNLSVGNYIVPFSWSLFFCALSCTLKEKWLFLYTHVFLISTWFDTWWGVVPASR